MTYATQEDLIDRFGERELKELADRDGDGDVDAAVVTAALTRADNLVDAYIRTRYVLPLAQVPALVVDLACDIARHALFGQGATEEVQARHDAAMRLLKDISAGKAELGLADGAEAPVEASPIAVEGPGRIFDRDRMKGF